MKSEWVAVLVVLVSLIFCCCFLHGCKIKVTRFVITKVPGASWMQGDLLELKNSHKKAPHVTLPASGSVLCSVTLNQKQDSKRKSIRLISWNIFLGQDLDVCIEELQKVDPDIILLQEDNIFLDEVTGKYRHCGGAIAQKLEMSSHFTPLYFRTKDKKPLRWDLETALEGNHLNGCYGVTILSRLPLFNIKAIKAEPRPELVESLSVCLAGWRYHLYCEVDISGKRLGLVTSHLPSAGLFREKLEMFDTLIADLPHYMPCLIAGDMNTISRIARFIPWGSTDLLFTARQEVDLFGEHLERKGLVATGKRSDRTHYFGKLDWIIQKLCQDFEFRNYQVQGPARGSDHRYLMVDISLKTSIS